MVTCLPGEEGEEEKQTHSARRRVSGPQPSWQVTAGREALELRPRLLFLLSFIKLSSRDRKILHKSGPCQHEP